MRESPKLMDAVAAVCGFGLGLLGLLVTEEPVTALLTAIVGVFVGIAWAGGLAYWWSRSKSTGLYAEWSVALLVFVVIAVFIGFPMASAGALGGYGLALFFVVRFKERQLHRPLAWQDLKPSRKDESQ